MTGWQVGLLVAALGIVSLYFLKLRRTPRRVPSTYLWMRAVEDMHVNSLFQRLRRNLLLFLQLLVMGLVFAAFFPLACTVQKDKGERYILLIDNSASMSATDVEPTRLEAAKQQALAIVDQMTHREDAAMVISFADGATGVLPFNTNRMQIRRQIEAIKQTEATTSILEALTVAAGLANPGSTGEDADPALMAADLYLFTDGRFSDVEGFALGNLKPHFVPIGSSSRNFGIAAMSTRRNEERPDQLQVFARVENFSEHEQRCPQRPDPDNPGAARTGNSDAACTCPSATVMTELFLDDESQDARELELQPKESKGVSFDLALLERGVLKLGLDVGDDLAIDNTAWTAVNPPRPARVLVVGPGDNPFLEIALDTEKVHDIARIDHQTPSYLDDGAYTQAADAGRYDLIIYDRCVPATMPQANTWLIGRLPSTEGFPAGTPAQWPVILDTDRSHRLMHYVAMETVEIAAMQRIDPPQGSQALVQTDQGPALVLVPREGFQDLVMTFELVSEGKVVRQGWHIHPSFPVFVYNVLGELGSAGESLGQGSTSPGRPVTLRHSERVEAVRVTTPEGVSHDVARTPQGTFLFGRTERTGVYEVQWPGQEEAEHFTVNLFDATESNIAPRQIVEIGYQEIEAEQGTRRERQELWKYFLLAALGVLVVEWYVYQRRVYF